MNELPVPNPTARIPTITLYVQWELFLERYDRSECAGSRAMRMIGSGYAMLSSFMLLSRRSERRGIMRNEETQSQMMSAGCIKR